MQHICTTPGCGNPASLACPTCIKLGLPACYFCNQDCFRNNWKEHKLIHLPIPDEYHGFVFTGPLRPAPRSPYRSLPASIQRPDYADTGVPSSERSRRSAVIVYSADELEIIREAGRIGRQILDTATAALHIGVTTDEIDRVVHEACISLNVYPSPLNYRDFPKSVCTSVNEVICHGIPDTRAIRDGDLINIDVSIYHRGVHSDLNETWLVTTRPQDCQTSIDLMSVAYRALMNCCQILRPGTSYRGVGDCIQGTVDEASRSSDGFSIVTTYCGHGVGFDFHASPTIPHYGRNKTRGVMEAGHVFTIEPMINAGRSNTHDETWPDNWTSVTRNGARSAQYEHTFVITETGYEIVTARREETNFICH